MAGASGSTKDDTAEFLPGAGFHFLTPMYEMLARPMLRGVWRDVVADVKTLAGTGTTLVDLGCGPGTVLRRLAIERPDLSLTGVDIDQRMLSIAGRRLPQARLLQASIDKVPIEDKSADIVISSMVFHHLEHPVKQGAFREARRILKLGGLFLLCDFSVPVNNWGAWLVRWFGKLESGVARQGTGELLEIAAPESLTLIPRWTRIGCITQHEVRIGQ
ncbi:MAG: class I SAM-dependent methyltransferase [Planctomycetia bacterium]|nr:class I SAM-dependent methyltransferase [Planctomycetia bacterium]